MKNERKTKNELIAELEFVRKRVNELGVFRAMVNEPPPASVKKMT